MKMVLGILKPDAGDVFVYGSDESAAPVEMKKKLGYVPETPQLYEFLTGIEYIDFVAEMYGVPPAERKARVSQFLGGLQLAGHENEMISGYSQGMKQKIAIISALVHRPQILVLDEALNGLDPRSARLVKDLLKELASEGVSILFSTHVLEIGAGPMRPSGDNVPRDDNGRGHRRGAEAEGRAPGLDPRRGLPEDARDRRPRRGREGTLPLGTEESP